MRRARILFTPSTPHSQLAFSALPHDSLRHSLTVEPHRYANLLQICLQQCKLVKTRNLFDKMPQSVSQSAKIAKLVHSQSLILGFWSKGYLGNAILDLYAKCGNVGYAEKIFCRLQTRDILAWNSFLSMFLKQGCFYVVVKSFGFLWNSGVIASEFTFAIVLSGCAKLEVVECGRQVHCNVVKMGFISSSFCQGALIDMYAKCSFMTDARRLFDRAADLDNVSWTSMIAGYVQAALPEEALGVIEEMKKVGQEPDEVASLTIINAFLALGRLDDASRLFFQIHNPNVVAWNMMISGHSKRGFKVEAIDFFRNMRKSGIRSTRSTMGSVLSAIANLAALDFGLLVHAEAIKLGLHSSVYVGSSLISMYTKCEKVEEARKVFDTLDERNTVLWNAMLGGYAQNGYTYEVFELFSDMERCGVCHDEFTYTSVLSACANLEYLEGGRQLHSVIIKKKLASNLFVGNALVDMYAKSGILKDARKQFELIRNKDNVSWNAIIVGYVQEEDVEAFHMFRRMNLLGILPDEVSLASILSACAKIKCLHRGTQVHCLSVKSGLERSLYAGSALVDMYAKCGDINSAQKVFSGMHQRNVASFNALIAGYVIIDFEKAMVLFQAMQAEGLKPSEITFASLLDACHGTQSLNIGRQLHCLILKKGIQHDDDFLGVSLLSMYMNSLSKTDGVMLFPEFSNSKSSILWTAMICGLIQNDCSEEALQSYSEMRSCNVLPDQATFVSILKACAVISSVKDGRQIHSLIFQIGYDSDELTCSALVDMYAKCGHVKSSIQVFAEMGSKNDVISWNSMIVGFAKNGYAIDALRVFDEMMQTNVRPDDITFLGVLTACSHAGKVSEGRRIFDIMVNFYGIQPRVDHCACMVDLLGRWGFLKEAEEFIDKQDFEPDPMIWATMLGACRIHGDEIRGQHAAEKLIEVEPQNSSSYVLLSNIYAASGNWDEVNSLRRAMRERGVKKLPGCSWIEVGRKTNMFVAGDKSHPSTSEIESVLKDLTVLMKKDINVAELDSFCHGIE